MNKSILVGMITLGIVYLSGCATPVQQSGVRACQAAGNCAEYLAKKDAELGRVQSQPDGWKERIRKAAAVMKDDDGPSKPASSRAIMSCGLKPMSCYSGCGCQCIGGAWQESCQ